MKHLKLTELPFVQHYDTSYITDEIVEETYNDFATEVFELYLNEKNRKEVRSVLLHAGLELDYIEQTRVEVLNQKPMCTQFLSKAKVLIERVQGFINNEIEHHYHQSEVVAASLPQTTVVMDAQCEDGCSCPKCKHPLNYKWTGSIVELVELMYALVETKSIDYGNIPINKLITDISTSIGVKVTDCYNSYVSIKKRKNESRTYYLDKLASTLNLKMNNEDCSEDSTAKTKS